MRGAKASTVPPWGGQACHGTEPAAGPTAGGHAAHPMTHCYYLTDKENMKLGKTSKAGELQNYQVAKGGINPTSLQYAS